MSEMHITRSQVSVTRYRWLLDACALVLAVLMATTSVSRAVENTNGAPQVIGNQTNHVFRTLSAAFTAEEPAARARVTSDLHAAIQDVFNRNHVRILSPHYQRDLLASKVVPESDWYAPPAVQPSQPPKSPKP